MTKGSAVKSGFDETYFGDAERRRNALNMSETFENMRLQDLNEPEYVDYVDGCFVGRETEDDGFIICDGCSIPNEQNATHYAEILTRTSCSAGKGSLGRRTRESDNPILRLCSSTSKSDLPKGIDRKSDCRSKITQDDLALYENMRSMKHASDYDTRNSQNGHKKIHCSRSDSELVCENTDTECLYENTGSEIIYENTSDEFNTSHVYENFEDYKKMRTSRDRSSVKSTTSNETSETESFYEDLDIVYEAMSPPSRQRPVSKPVDIVYTSIDFGGNADSSPISVESFSNSGSFGSLERTEIRRCTSYCYGNKPLGVGKPPEPPQRCSGSFTRRSRPRSLHIGNPDGFQTTDFGLGLYTGTLVGSCTITKTSPKSVQKIIGEYLAREKKEHSKPVSFQVTSEFLCLSYNCAPWWLLAKNSVDDIGCITTYSANNRTALGYTVSKPGEDARLFVIHCSDADQIKEAIVTNFKRPVTASSLSRWCSMSALGSSKSMSLPRMGTSTCRRRNEIASFDDLVYLGSRKVKKSFLVVNDNISAVLDHRDSKEYTVAKIELYKDAIHLKDSKQDRLLDIHQLEWILSTSLFDEDRRYFGYISSKAFQGSKTRTACHVFRCNRVGLASQIMETIRQACQATYLARTCDYPPELRSRTYSSTSTGSEGSISSSPDTISLGSTNSSPSEVDIRIRKRPGRFLPKRLSRNRMSTIQSFTEDSDTGIETLGEEPSEVSAPGNRPRTTRNARDEVPPPPGKVPPPPGKVPQQPEKVHVPAQTSNERVLPLDEAPNSEDCRSEESILEERISQECTEKRFSVFYLISTILSPPLKGKHVKECLKQFQKSVDKAMKKSEDSSQHYKKAHLVFSPKGVSMLNDQTQTPQAFYERATISAVQNHPKGMCAFAFTTVVSGSTKHKCHLFLQDEDPIDPIVKELQTYIQ